MQTLLVTGGAGFIGATFVRRMFRETETRIINLDALTYASNRESLSEIEGNPNYHFVQGNIGDKRLVAELLAEYQCDAIVNFAAESHVDRSIESPEEFIQTNVVGTFRLLDAALGHFAALTGEAKSRFRFLHVSTDEVYGSLGATGQFTETSPYAPHSPYSASKASSDHFVRAYLHTYGLPILVTNCSNNYGPYQFPEKLIPRMILNVLRGEKLPVYGRGEHVRDWLHVDDHCRALQMVLERGQVGDTYNIGGNCERKNLDVVRIVCETVKRVAKDRPIASAEELIEYVTDRPGHDLRYAIDSTKLRVELGFSPAIGFSAGIEATVRWYLENEAWVESVCEGYVPSQRVGLGRQRGGENTFETTVHSANVDGVHFFPIKTLEDERGWLAELYRHDEIPVENRPVMAYVSETKPGVSRGPHEHAEQSDYFAFMGPGDFRLFIWDARQDSPTFGTKCVCTVGESNPQAVIVPPGVVHAYKNSGDSAAWVFNAPNRLYAGEGKQEAVDEIRHESDANSPYTLAED